MIEDAIRVLIREELHAVLGNIESRLTAAEQRPMTVKQAAAVLGVSEKTVRRHADAGKLQHRRIGARITIYLAPPR